MSHMKLLIVDDEKITREGLLEAIDWNELGITDIRLAEDGQKALDLIESFSPDIVLSDVRMPQLSGIEMAERLSELLPGSELIFMSGYSDKEYLKAAIRLNAVSYVEKPIDVDELRGAILDAAERIDREYQRRAGASVQAHETESILMERLMRPGLSDPLDGLSPPRGLQASDYFTSVLLEFEAPISSLPAQTLALVRNEISAFLNTLSLSYIYTIKNNRYYSAFVYGPSSHQDEKIHTVAAGLRRILAPYGHFTLAAGDTVSGIGQAFSSYTSAVVLLQQGFYHEPDTDIFELTIPMEASPIFRDYTVDLFDALMKNDEALTYSILDEVRGQFRVPCPLLPSQAKDIYYKLILQLQKAAYNTKTPLFGSEENSLIFETVSSAHSIVSLHDTLLSHTKRYFSMIADRSGENAICFSIEEFVRQNFQNESLSVKTISDHVNRSTSYVCTVFKNETGMTLNQFITKCRMEKAKEMLTDPRYKITDIASRVGYLDVNYFGKIFKKYSGVTPSDYRGTLVK